MKVFFLVLFVLPIIAFAGSVNVLSSFYSPDWFPNGLAWDGNNLWVSCPGSQIIIKMSTDGTVLSSFSIPHTNPRDMAWNGTHLFYTARDDKLIVEVTTDGVIIDTFNTWLKLPSIHTYTVLFNGSYIVEAFVDQISSV